MELGEGTRVLITGASRGIGNIVAHAFASRGCTLGLVSRSRAELDRAAAELPGDGHVALEADVGDRASMAAAVERFGEVDVVVANAGIAHYQPFAEIDLDLAEQMTRVNWLGTLYTVKPALPGMIERGRGHVVIVSSGGGIRVFPGATVYGATKAAQRGLAEALRHELNGTGVSVTTVYPGLLATTLHDHEKETMPAWYKARRPEDPAPIGERVAAGVEADAREVFFPSNVRMLRVFAGLSPRLADAMLRRIIAEGAAPRRG